MTPRGRRLSCAPTPPSQVGGGVLELFDRHFDAIHRYVARRLGTAIADELASQTFLQAFERRRFYEPRSETARPWLFGVAANLLREHRRRERRQLLAYARTGVDPVFQGHSESVERLDASSCGRRLAGLGIGHLTLR